jgi:hypothetical protein
MRNFGQINTEFWSSPKTKRFSHSAKLLAVYFLTCPSHTCIGCYRIPIAYVAHDLVMEREQVLSALDELEAENFCFYDHDVEWVFIPSFMKWNKISNKNVGKAAKGQIANVPHDFLFYDEVVAAAVAFGRGFIEEIETVLKPFRNGLRTVSKQGEGEREGEKGLLQGRKSLGSS